MGKAVPWFPFIGLVLGAIQGGIYVGVSELAPATLAAVLSVAVLALLTGAFHQDGLADMADAFGGGWTREQRLEIMKDSRLGTYGTTALILIFALEIAALGSLSGWVAFAAVVVAHSLSRAIAISMMVAAQPAAASGLGVDYLRGLPRTAVVVSAAIITCGAAIGLGVAGAVAVLSALLAGVAVVRLAHAKIGGITGDVLGAIQQVAKIASLIAVVVIAETTLDLGVVGRLAQ